MKKDVNLITKDFYIRYTWFKHMSWCELLLFTDSTFFLECFLQVLRQLAPDVSYRSLVMLGIASVEGLSVASFENDDAERLLFFCTKQGKVIHPNNSVLAVSPSWLMPPPPSRKSSEPCQETKLVTFSSLKRKNGDKRNGRQKMNIAAMRPIPHSHRQKMVPFSGISEPERLDGDQGKKNFPVAPAKHSMPGPTVVTHRKSSSFQAQQIISLNPLPLKKHGCGRSPIQVCLEVSHLVSSSKSGLALLSVSLLKWFHISFSWVREPFSFKVTHTCQVIKCSEVLYKIYSLIKILCHKTSFTQQYIPVLE